MEIEKEIKQSVKFASEYQKVAVNILYTASWITSHHTKMLKQFGLTPQQFNVLRILRGQHPKPATINLLIDRMLDKSSNASRLVDRLSQKDFVQRCTNDEDKRSVNVKITDKGLSVLAQIDKDSDALEKHLHSISKEEAHELSKLLDKMRD